MKNPSLIIIAGPTAVGKTNVSTWLAKQLSSVIISADSRQFFKEMKIGTAAPTAEEQQDIPHYFVGNLSLADKYNIAEFEKDVLELLNDLFLKNEFVIMTGGSGLYINAVCRGIDEIPDADDSYREELVNLYRRNGIEALRDKLKELDPVYYNRVDLSNPHRLIRALEVCMSTGKPFSSLRSETAKNRPFNIIKIGLTRDRKELHLRINERVDQMISDGLVEEAAKLLPYRHLNSLNTVGYKELFSYFDGQISLDQAIADIKTHSRQYAKRQMTWFRKDQEFVWFHPDEKENILSFIKSRTDDKTDS